MIQVENYGAGVRWYCTECDRLYNEWGTLVVHYTNSTPPEKCTRCDEQAMHVCWENGNPAFISMVLTRRDAALMQRTLKEGSIVSVERGRELKRQLVNGPV
jgi:hypothetical protein